MITGIGIDVIQNERIRQSVQRFGDRFLNRIYTEGEIGYCKKCANPEIHYAARFAAKEAAFKALGDADVLHDGLLDACTGGEDASARAGDDVDEMTTVMAPAEPQPLVQQRKIVFTFPEESTCFLIGRDSLSPCRVVRQYDAAL